MLRDAPWPPSARRPGVPLPTTLLAGRPFCGLLPPGPMCDRLTGMPDGKTGGPDDDGGERW